MAPERVLPCPFCGSQPKVTERPGTPGDRSAYLCFVVCMCGGYSARAHQTGKGDAPQAARAEAIEAWNRRAPTEAGRALEQSNDEVGRT